MRNLKQLRDNQRSNQNPGSNIGSFLLEHSNCPEYLVSQLQAYLRAAEADLKDFQTQRSKMIESMKVGG